MGKQDEYLNRYREQQSWYRSSFAEKRIPSSGGGTLRVALPNRTSPKVATVVISGRTEYIEKYIEFARDLDHRGISVCLYDHCGQGASDRQLEDPQKGHIDRFDTYVEDLHRVVGELSGADGLDQVRLISHSMGGTVSMLYAMRHPGRINSLVLGSPMCAIRTNSIFPQFLIKPYVSAACRLGRGAHYVATTGPYQPVLTFKENLFTSDEVRFRYNRFLTNLLDFAPLGGPTYSWLHEAYKAMRAVNASIERIPFPMLIFAAPNDQVIKSGVIKRFCTSSEYCSVQEYDDGRHELFMEVDRIRDDILTRTVDFFKKSL